MIFDKSLIKRGYEWVKKHYLKIADLKLYSSELCHHGIKGQKWGVKNGPPYPLERTSDGDLKKSNNCDRIIKDAIASGQVSKKINREKQLRHTEKEHIPGRSYIYGDLEHAQKLIDELSGTGTPVMSSNIWLRKEKVSSENIIGVHVSRDGTESQTNKAMIVYSKTGTHIYPRKGEEL